MIRTWLGTSWSEATLVVISTLAVFGAVIAYTRVAGLRSLAKMSSFDFAMTIAVGSLIGSTSSSSSVTLANGVLAVGLLFLLQVSIVFGRRRLGLGRIVDNQPVLLMIGSEMLEDNMRRCRVTRDDLWARIREANVLDPSTIAAVVMETTGTLSVLHGGALSIRTCSAQCPTQIRSAEAAVGSAQRRSGDHDRHLRQERLGTLSSRAAQPDSSLACVSPARSTSEASAFDSSVRSTSLGPGGSRYAASR